MPQEKERRDPQDFLKTISNKRKTKLEELISREVKEKALRLLWLRQIIEEHEKEAEEKRGELIILVPIVNQETDPEKPPKVVIEDVEVTLIPMVPRFIIKPTDFFALIKKRISDEDLREAVLADCLEINWDKAVKNLALFGITEANLRSIAQKVQRGPRVEVKILAKGGEK